MATAMARRHPLSTLRALNHLLLCIFILVNTCAIGSSAVAVATKELNVKEVPPAKERRAVESVPGLDRQSDEVEGYEVGQAVPVSCLQRDLETGSHITDDAGYLLWTPFATCNETASPLTIPYGVSKTLTCTIDPVTDEYYHLLEYYVHNDAPLTCRVPSLPQPADDQEELAKLSPAAREAREVERRRTDLGPYTPVTVALQGTLQLSHLHVWTEMNMIIHAGRFPQSNPNNIPKHGKKARQARKQRNRKKNKQQPPAQIIAGTAYSLPLTTTPKISKTVLDSTRLQTRDLWAPGLGSKVVRGQALTMSFHLTWLDADGDLVPAIVRSKQRSWPAGEKLATVAGAGAQGSSGGGAFASLVYFAVAAVVGGVVAVWWDRRVGIERGGRWRGRTVGGGAGGAGGGLLGQSQRQGAPGLGFFHPEGKVSIGTGGIANGYGGYGGYGKGGKRID